MTDNYLCYTHTNTHTHTQTNKQTNTHTFIYIYILLRFPLVYIQLVSNTTYLLQYYTSSKFVEFKCKKSYFIPKPSYLGSSDLFCNKKFI